jgi:hypothetical protein
MVQAPQPLGMIQCYDNNNFGGGGVKDKYRITFPPTATLSEKLGLLVRPESRDCTPACI